MPKRKKPTKRNVYGARGARAVRYYVALILALLVLFFSNDFGTTDVQKTAIVMAVGIDRQEEEFIVTSQIAIPQSSKQGGASQAVQLVSKGKTVAEAFAQINAKTGWYPKLVFCRLILLGNSATEKNVFDALNYFKLNNYVPDNCLLAACDGAAKDVLNTGALVDSAGSLAIEKVLSSHAQRVGSALPSTLREFAIGYFGESQSSYLPVIHKEPQQEESGSNNPEQNAAPNQNNGQGGQNGQSGKSSGGSEQQSGGGGQSQSEKPLFSAGKTALFVKGKQQDILTEEETFAVCAVKEELRLASYRVEADGAACTLTIKNNRPSLDYTFHNDGTAALRIHITLTAGMLDYSQPLELEKMKDAGEVPDGVFAAAEKRLQGQIVTAFEKCRACGCDIFELTGELHKNKPEYFPEQKSKVLENTLLDVSVTFRNVR